MQAEAKPEERTENIGKALPFPRDPKCEIALSPLKGSYWDVSGTLVGYNSWGIIGSNREILPISPDWRGIFRVHMACRV